MTLTDQNFTIYTGDNADLIIAVTLCGTTTPKDLTLATIVWVLYNDDTDEVLVTKTVGVGITITNPVGGIFKVSLIPADTVNLSPTKTYIHQGEVTDGSGDDCTVITGHVTVKRSYA